MSKIKVVVLMDSIKSLQEVSQEKLPLKLAYKLSMLLSEATRVVDPFQKARFERIKELGDEVMNEGKPTGYYRVKPENLAQWEEERKELDLEEVDLDIPEVKLDDLGDIKVSPAALSGLDWLIKAE